ncbi:MAG: PIN domain-containing protein, partial [Flavobacterium sp.]
KADQLSEEFNRKFDSILKKSRTIILPYPTIHTAKLFNSYFKEEKPFGKGDKKHEFPDAIAMETIVQWSKTTKQSCVVLSNDNDFIKSSNNKLNFEKDYKAYLNDALTRILAERKKTVDMLIRKNKGIIVKDVKDWVRDKLEDNTIYYEVTSWLDVHDIRISKVKGSVKNYQVISSDNEYIKAEITVAIVTAIIVTTDDESSAIRDSDDKSWYYPRTIQIKIEQSFEIPVIAKFHVISKDDYDDHVEIEQYNNDKELEIEVDNDEY